MSLTQEKVEERRRLALEYHRKEHGKISVVGKAKLAEKADLALAYTPGVAEPCLEIARDAELAYEYTAKGNLVAVVSDGTAVLGLGDIGGQAGMPVMEGKSVLFKRFAGVDAFPICLNVTGVEEIIAVVKALEPSFGGVNLEDISAPRCFEIEERLKKEMNIPVFHDDQHGTAIITTAAVINALRLVGKKAGEVRAVMNGAGAAGIAVAKLLKQLGLTDITICDRSGAIYQGRPKGMNPFKDEVATWTNPKKVQGSLADALVGADIFIGLSAPGAVTGAMVKTMAKDPIIMACANPTPEIFPDEALAAGARVVATGRSDFPNQINNVLAFPGVFRGALDVRATGINDTMKMAAARAIADLVSSAELKAEYILPTAWDERVAPAVAAAVAKTAIETGVAKRPEDPAKVAEHTRKLVETEVNA